MYNPGDTVTMYKIECGVFETWRPAIVVRETAKRVTVSFINWDGITVNRSVSKNTIAPRAAGTIAFNGNVPKTQLNWERRTISAILSKQRKAA